MGNRNRLSGGSRLRPRIPRRGGPEENFDWKKSLRTIALWAVLILVVWLILSRANMFQSPTVSKSFTQYRQLLESGQVESADITDRQFRGRLKDGTVFITLLPFIDQNMLAEWDSLGIDYQFKEKSAGWFEQIFWSLLPWVLIFALWIYLLRRMQGGGNARGIFNFGKSRAKLLMENKPRVTFDDVAGCEEAKTELKEIIEFLRDPKKFTRLGGRIPKGVLLLGPPGTGKTLLARAVAGEAGVPFLSISGADFVEMFVGVGAARVRDLFETGKKFAPCIIFIDEIDAVGRHRGAGLGGGHDEREQTLNQLLVEMDGFESNEGVILIAATNRPDVLDPALTRPGRFDRQIVVDRPDVRGREAILKVHTRKIPLGDDVKLEVIAKGTPGLAGAELANIVNEAALLAARRGANEVSMADFEEAKDKVMMGLERRSVLISETEKRQTAYHEAGHVLVAKLTPGTDPVHKVTIIPRGRALGLTAYLPLDERHNYTRTYLRNTLVQLLGGRAAEKVIFSELSTGAGNDIERATEIARRMVCEWGMSDRLGPVALGRKQEEIFLGRELAVHRDFSERTAQEIDNEVKRMVSEAERTAERLIRNNLDKLTLIAEALLEREILDGEEIDILLKGGKLPAPAGKGVVHSEKGKILTSEGDQIGPSALSGDGRVSSSLPVGGGRSSRSSRSSSSRRQLARRHGVVSSSDPENLRPSPSQLAKMPSPYVSSGTGESKGSVREMSSGDESKGKNEPVARSGEPSKTGGTRRRRIRKRKGGRKGVESAPREGMPDTSGEDNPEQTG